MTLVSQAVFARMCKTTPKTVTKWKQEQRLVMQGTLVDVEATDERMKRYRRKGSPIVLSPAKVLEKGNASGEKGNSNDVTLQKGNDQVVTLLPCAEILEQLRTLDWTQQFDWSAEALLQRARGAAKCIGWDAVESNVLDDGHWGGFQLRVADWAEHDRLTQIAVVAGHGYNLSALEVLFEVREEIETILQQDDTMEIHPSLLPLVARPFFEGDRPQGQ